MHCRSRTIYYKMNVTSASDLDTSHYYTMNVSSTEDVDVIKYASDSFLILLQTVCMLVMLVGIPGNVMVIFIILWNKHMRKSSTILIVLLSLADVLYFTTVLPIRFATFLYADWIFSDTLCCFVGGMAHFTFGVSMCSMSAIALSRYLHVFHHNMYRKLFGKLGLALQITFMVGFLALWIIILPMAGVWGDYIYQEEILSCTFNPDGNLSFKYVMLCVSIMTPLLFTILCYGLIYYKVRRIKQRVQRWNPNRVQPGGVRSMAGNENSISTMPENSVSTVQSQQHHVSWMASSLKSESGSLQPECRTLYLHRMSSWSQL